MSNFPSFNDLLKDEQFSNNLTLMMRVDNENDAKEALKEMIVGFDITPEKAGIIFNNPIGRAWAADFFGAMESAMIERACRNKFAIPIIRHVSEARDELAGDFSGNGMHVRYMLERFK